MSRYWYDASICYPRVKSPTIKILFWFIIICLHCFKFNECSPVQWIDNDMMLASLIWSQFPRLTDCRPVQWVDNDLMLASRKLWQYSRFNDFSPVQWVDIAMMLACVILNCLRYNDCSPVQWVDIDMMLASVIWLQRPRFNDCSREQ
jgi:hypothetical protein